MLTDCDHWPLHSTIFGCKSEVVLGMNRELLELRLAKVFDADPAERRVVVRQAGDLHDSELYAETHDHSLSVDLIIGNLAEAPDELALAERWNWWMGALDLAHDGYERFRIQAWAVE